MISFKTFFRNMALLSVLFLSGMMVQQLHAEAHYVYHTRSTSDQFPGCNGTPYVSDYSPTLGQLCTLAFKVEYQFYTNTAAIYYTTDGSNPSGAFGIGSGATQVAMAYFDCSFFNGNTVDVWKAIIPGQNSCGTVKYIMSAWHSGGGDEIFANGPGSPCNCGFPTNNSSLATVFSYDVVGNQVFTVVERDNSCFGGAKGKAAAKPRTPGDYTFSWSNGGSTFKIEDLLSGTYDLTVSESTTGCQSVFSYNITEPATPLEITSTQYYNFDPYHAVTINGAGGTLPYTFSLIGVQPFTASSTTSYSFVFTGPPPPYKAAIRDAGGIGCTAKATVTAGGATFTQEDESDLLSTGYAGPAGQLTAFPNPVATDFQLTMVAKSDDPNGEIILTNAQGQVLSRRSAIIVKGYNQWSFDLSEYPPGMFSVNLMTDGEQMTIPLVKQ